MARANTRTLLSIDRFGAILGMHPIHLNQVSISDIPACNDIIVQHAWQASGRVSREDIAMAIAQAEANLARELGYYVAPTWTVEDLVRVSEWNWNGRAGHGHLIGGGIEALSLIDDAVTITYSSKFSGATYEEVATVTVNTSVTDPEEIAVFYPASLISEYGASGGDYAWEIRPISVSISGGVATIKFARHQCVIPDLLEEWVPEAVEGTTDDNFLTTVDVYRHYNDPSEQVEFRYKSSCCICDSGCAQCTYSTTEGCLLVTDHKLGFIALTPSSWDGTSHIFNLDAVMCDRPSGAALKYMSGWRYGSTFRQMDPDLEKIVAHYALSLLGQSLCSCSHIENKFDYYTAQPSSRPVQDQDYLPSSLFRESNPLGTTRAAMEAWEFVKSRALARKVALA